jgi:hypothetical protein
VERRGSHAHPEPPESFASRSDNMSYLPESSNHVDEYHIVRIYPAKLIEERSALFQKLEMTKMGDVRRKLWHELIEIEEATGHGLSKAVSKLYASWLRTARMKQDATLEVDEDDNSIIEWGGGIRISLPQLKNWVIFQIGKLPREHRVALIRCCEQYPSFNDLQAAELCRQLFQDSHSARSFMKLFRKALITGVMG